MAKQYKQMLKELLAIKKALLDSIDGDYFLPIEAELAQRAENEPAKALTNKSRPDFSDFKLPSAISDFLFDYALYTDGASRGNPGAGAYAYILQDATGAVLKNEAVLALDVTNNQMELMGVLAGMRELLPLLKEKGVEAKDCKIWVYSDSQYVIKGMKEWMPGWKARGWKKGDNKAPENLELWQQLDEAQSQFGRLHFEWVKGHAGHPQNEYCDQMANEVLDSNGH